jgi:hypothetical protein
VSFVVELESRWWNIEASSPNLDLLLTVLFNSLQFVQALESSIMSFIESPILNNWNVVAIKFISSIVESLDSSGEDRCVADIKLISILGQYFSCLDCFLDS